MRVADVMTPHVITVREDATITEAARLMLQKHVSGLPIVDAAGNIAGIVTEGDFLRRTESGTERRRPRWLEFILGPGKLAAEYVSTHGRKVGEVMTRDVATVTESEPLENAIRLMERRRVKRIPVVRDGKVVGIVSRANLLHLLASSAAQIKPADASDSAIRAKILAELDKQPWAPTTSVNVIVRNGVVELRGAIFDERERTALRVAAENVAGVKEIQDHVIWIEPMSGMALDATNDGTAAR